MGEPLQSPTAPVGSTTSVVVPRAIEAAGTGIFVRPTCCLRAEAMVSALPATSRTSRAAVLDAWIEKRTPSFANFSNPKD
jgi:hypothetical protein